MDDNPYDNDRKNMERLIDAIPNATTRGRVREYLAERDAQGIRASTLALMARALLDLAIVLGACPVDQAERADFVRFFSSPSGLTGKPLAPSTRHIRAIMVGRFMKWLQGTKDYPSEVEGLIGKPPKARRRRPDEVMSRSDLQQILLHCRDVQSKALALLLWDLGLRASEPVALKVGSIQFGDVDAIVSLPEEAPYLKMGPRSAVLTEATEFLRAWLACHPCRDDPEAPLFGTFKDGRMRPLNRGTLSYRCVSMARRAGLKVHTNPHTFRHSSATEKGRQAWDDDLMRAQFGWANHSSMPSHYRHNTDAERRNKVRINAGLPPLEGTDGETVRFRRCPYCDSLNQGLANFCHMCGRAQRDDAAAAAQKREANRTRLLGEIARHLIDRQEQGDAAAES